MPSLIFEYSGSRSGGIITGRILIGRRLSRGVVIGDPAVSRLHAWIDKQDGVFVLTDAGSRTGTIVNGEAIVRCELQDGDQIKIGPANLTYHETSELPPDTPELDFSTPGTIESSHAGILFDCKCGAPMWVPVKMAGKQGLCKYCGEPLRVPRAPRPKPVAKPGRKLRPEAPVLSAAKCGVCHSALEGDEPTTECPDCHTTFHTDCWQENYGCSTYGCAKVNSLKPASVALEEQAAAAVVPATADPALVEAEKEVPFPWELVILAGSVVGSLIGAVLFGAPPALIALFALGVLARGKSQKRGMLAAALLLAIAGTLAGLAVSDFMWMDGRHLPILLR